MSERDESARLYQKGTTIVYTIAIVNVAWVILSMLLIGTHIFSLIIQIALSIALCLKVNWVRWLVVVGSAILVLLSLFVYWRVPASDTVFRIIQFAYSAYLFASAIILACSRSVNEFFKKGNSKHTQRKGKPCKKTTSHN